MNYKKHIASIIFLFIIIPNILHASDTTLVKISYGKSIFSKNEQFEELVKKYGDYQLFNNIKTSNIIINYYFYEGLGVNMIFSVGNNSNTINSYNSSFFKYNISFGLNYEFIKINKFSSSIYTNIGFYYGQYQFDDLRESYSSIDSVFTHGQTYFIKQNDVTYNLAIDFNYNIYRSLTFSIVLNYSSSLDKSHYYHNKSGVAILDLDKYKNTFYGIQFGLGYIF